MASKGLIMFALLLAAAFLVSTADETQAKKEETKAGVQGYGGGGYHGGGGGYHGGGGGGYPGHGGGGGGGYPGHGGGGGSGCRYQCCGHGHCYQNRDQNETNERHRFNVETLAGENHGRTKAQLHYDGEVLQARDDMPFLGATTGVYIYEEYRRVLVGQENKLYSYTLASIETSRIWITCQQSPP